MVSKNIFLNKKHWCKHHKMSPIKNTTVYTAAIAHNVSLERAEKQNADIITQEIKYTQHDQIHFCDHTQ